MFWSRNRSVAGIMATFNRKVKQLDKLAKEMEVKHGRKRAKADRIHEQASAALVESVDARNMADKLAEFSGVTREV